MRMEMLYICQVIYLGYSPPIYACALNCKGHEACACSIGVAIITHRKIFAINRQLA